jgi:DNA-binding transcriptional LysR family regulator
VGIVAASKAQRAWDELNDRQTGELFVLLTRAGRAAARAGLGILPEPRREPWEVREWLWRELAKVARAGQEGLPTGDLFGLAHLYLVEGEPTRGNRPLLTVVTTWVEYTPRDFYGTPYGYTSKRDVRRYHFTEAGRAYYAEHRAAYLEWYPDIDAPELPAEEPAEG